MEDAILKTSDSEPVKPVKEKYPIQVHANFEKEDYKKSISDMIHYIYEGDIYIANMTQQLTIESKKAPQDVFYNLRKNNPSPFGGYLDFDHYQIVCASPERFLKLTDGHVETRPIKGTRKRGETEKEDLRLRKELENSEKDKSELLMIVDLERNDLIYLPSKNTQQSFISYPGLKVIWRTRKTLPIFLWRHFQVVLLLVHQSTAPWK